MIRMVCVGRALKVNLVLAPIFDVGCILPWKHVGEKKLASLCMLAAENMSLVW